MRRAVLPLLLSLALFPACGSVGGGGADGDGGGGNVIDGGPADADFPPGETFSVDWGPLEVPAGAEDTRCVTVRLNNPRQIRVGAINNVLGATSHHYIVYRVNDTVEQLEPTPCQPFLDTLDPANGAPLMITQVANETLNLPEGVAYTLEANQMLRLEMHYLNATDSTQTLDATSTFVDITNTNFEHEADFLFIGNPDISIPPGQAASLGPTYFPLPLANVSFFGITGHTHQWGTDVRVAITPSADGADTPVYELDNFFWDEPETVMHDPPFTVPSGGGFRFTCEWNNQSGSTVGFGEGANDEMCFFWAYYFPSNGAKICFHTDQVGNGLDVCCPGDALCSLVDDFLAGNL